jgi:hypothetical protein
LIDFKPGGVEAQRLDADDGMDALFKMLAILKKF